MKHKKGRIILTTLLTLALLLTAYPIPASAATTARQETRYATISQYELNLRVGKTRQLKCSGIDGKITWKSSKPSVATVTSKGVVKAIKPGKATISATNSNMIGTLKCEVRVSKKITQTQAKKKLASLKKKFPEGMSWTNENQEYFWEATNCQCYGCIAFAGKLSDLVFGKTAPVKTHTDFDKIKVGDHIRIGESHSVIVLEKKKNSVIVAEGNYNSSVHWGREITKRELDAEGFYVDTRY